MPDRAVVGGAVVSVGLQDNRSCGWARGGPRVTLTSAHRLEAGMHGSPTLLIDGVGPFAGPGQTPACRAGCTAARPGRPMALRRWPRSAACSRLPARPEPDLMSPEHMRASGPARNRIRLVSCRSSVRQAACVYSLIRPLRDLLCVDVGHGGAGMSGSLSGTCCAMLWCGLAVL
jgi:hypothetical protein